MMCICCNQAYKYIKNKSNSHYEHKAEIVSTFYLHVEVFQTEAVDYKEVCISYVMCRISVLSTGSLNRG
jgi:hypothetical protein